MTLKGILFDLDGLLLDTEAVGMEAFAEAVTSFGMARPEAETLYLSTIGISFARSRDILSQVFPGEDMDAFDAAWTAGMGRRLERHVPLRPTVREVFDTLARGEVPMAVVTSSRKKYARLKLERVGMLPHLTALVTADDVAQTKPDPEPYLRGAAALGLPPELCAAFEDSDTGTQAAVAAGCVTWQIPDLRPLDTPLPQLGQTVKPTLLDAVADAGFLTLPVA